MDTQDDAERAATDPREKDSADDYSVWWNEPADQDPENPMSWTNGRKWGIIANLSLISFVTWVRSAGLAHL